MLGVQRRWWFDLLVWQHKALAKMASLAECVPPNPSVWQLGGESFCPETSMLRKGSLWREFTPPQQSKSHRSGWCQMHWGHCHGPSS